MSGDGPTGGDPFEGLPFLNQLGDLFGRPGHGGLDGARALALNLATGGHSEPNVDPLERIRIEALSRVAELHVADVTGLAVATGGTVQVVPVTRATWAAATVQAYQPLFERLSAALAPPDAPGDEPDPDPLSAMLSQMFRAVQPMMLSMTAGSMVGHLARRCLGQYDLPIPRPGDEIMVVVPNLDELAEQWSLPADDLRLWVCVHELAHHAVLGVAHVRAALDDLLGRYASGFSAELSGLDERLSSLDPADPSAMGELQRLLGDPTALLGAIRTPEQEALRPALDAVVAVVVGVVDHVVDIVGERVMAGAGRLHEALRRRRVETAEADRFVERLLGLELSQTTYDRGGRFVAGVVERAGEEGLRRLWEAPDRLPTPSEVDAPGLWLARIDL